MNSSVNSVNRVTFDLDISDRPRGRLQGLSTQPPQAHPRQEGHEEDHAPLGQGGDGRFTDHAHVARVHDLAVDSPVLVPPPSVRIRTKVLSPSTRSSTLTYGVQVLMVRRD